MRQAYERMYGPAPAGAAFGVDISWYQAASNGATDYGAALACWRDRVTPWAEWACIRVSVGARSVDDAWPLHLQAAAATGYHGTIGAYHFAYPNLNTPEAEATNFLNQWAQHPWAFAMLDMEIQAAGVDLSPWARRWCDIVKAATGRDPLLYTAQWFTRNNMTGTEAATCPLWVAHYAKGGTVGDGIPLLPAWATSYGIWQYDSNTPELGSLDLNICIDPSLVGLDTLGTADTATPNTIEELMADPDLRQLIEETHDAVRTKLDQFDAPGIGKPALVDVWVQANHASSQADQILATINALAAHAGVTPPKTLADYRDDEILGEAVKRLMMQQGTQVKV